MALFYCFGKNRKKTKVDVKPLPDVEKNNVMKTFEVKLENPVKSSEQPNSLSVPVLFNFPENSKCKVKLLSPDISAEKESFEVAYEGEDERDDKSPISRDNSDCNLQAHDIDSGSAVNVDSKTKYGEDTDERVTDSAMVQCGHVSDPGMAREERWAPPQLTRSCSALDTRELAEKVKGTDVFLGSPCRSQSSALTHRSADKVMLKKHSSSQILPSRSRKLWWKLFLWSHRNLQKPLNADKTRVSHLVSLNQQGGYSSDPLEPSRVHKVRKQESAGSSSEICSYKSRDKDNTDGFEGGVSGLWPQNQWVAFSRVEDWVKDIDIHPNASSFEEEKDEEQHIEFPPSPEASCSFAKDATHVSKYNKINLSEELLYANSVVQSLNSSSTVAHISGLGLKAIPMIAQFSSLRTVNLSNNSIVQITPGSLPRGLHVLDLSKNSISSIDGLRELTRLRIVDLSYNRISRLGHGLSNCSLLKELYLAGNKISEVEGLHRLLKLTVLDLSFNKITTTKALGQLVANYHSLLGLNLLGNPVQSNLGEDQLRRAVCGLLPKLAYLNKQPVNQQKARDLSIDIVNKASSRSSSYGARRKVIKRGAQSGAPAKSSASVAPRSRKTSKSRGNNQSSLKKRA